MNEVVVNILVVGGFILLGAVFAAAEMSLVSLRDSQIRQLSAKGKRGKQIAALTDDPNRFLSLASADRRGWHGNATVSCVVIAGG